MNENEIQFTELLEKAKEASKTSYSPYSKFAVGAACLFESGNIYLGSNIENVSYGIGLCAERNALSTALAAGEKASLQQLLCTALIKNTVFLAEPAFNGSANLARCAAIIMILQ